MLCTHGDNEEFSEPLKAIRKNQSVFSQLFQRKKLLQDGKTIVKVSACFI